MKHLGYSELTKRLYILPVSARKPKVDITDDINEFIKFRLIDFTQWLVDSGYYINSIGKLFNENDTVDIHYTINELFDKFNSEPNPERSDATKAK